MPHERRNIFKKYMHGNISIIGKKVPFVRILYNPLAFLARLSVFKVQDFLLTSTHEEFHAQVDNVEVIAPSSPKTEHPIIILAADYDYTKKFAEQLIRSLHSHNERSFFYYLHIVGGPKEEILYIAEKLREFLKDDFRLTWEDNDLATATYHNRRRYLQCIRFWHAREAMYRWRRPLLILDIDVVCRGPMDHFVKDFMRAGDVGLWERDLQYDPGKKILAGAVWLNPTSGAMAFLDRAVKRMFLHLAKAFFTRKLDQRSLYLARKSLGASLSTFALPDGFISLHPQDHCVLYAADGTLEEKAEKLKAALKSPAVQSIEQMRALRDSGT